MRHKAFGVFSVVFAFALWYNSGMENTGLDREKLNTMDKDILVELVMKQSQQIDELNANVSRLIEQMRLSSQRQFGRKSEAGLVDENQLSFFNEIEAEAEKHDGSEPEIETVVKSYKRRRKGKRDEDLSGIPVRVENHEIPEDKLHELFPDGYRHLPDEIYRKLEFHPATFEVVEHHIKVYKSRKGAEIAKADHPAEMLEKSIATSSLVASVINAKYTNSMPLYRQEKEFERRDVRISRQVMSSWVIRTAERYLSLVYSAMKQTLLSSSVIHADETPVIVKKDGREGIHKSSMWVYRTGLLCGSVPAVIYEYQKTRSQEHPRRFLEGYAGALVCDGYQVYHGLEKSTDITVCGCWAHARRKFADIVKSADKQGVKDTVAGEALALIAAIYHEENKLAELDSSERLERRQKNVRPLVESFFAWAKEKYSQMAPQAATGQALKYCINQERYLTEFLGNPMAPIDNNAAEQAIRNFCIGKKNWNIIDTVHGADASAMLYSIVETAKANSLKIYEYLEYLLSEIPKHMDETDLNFIQDLLPWSEALPEKCRKKK